MPLPVEIVTDPASRYIIMQLDTHAGRARYVYMTHPPTSKQSAPYWGRYNDAPYPLSATRFLGGPELDQKLSAHPSWIAVEVKDATPR